MTPQIDLYVVVERSVFDTRAAWLVALAELAALDVPGLALQVRAKDEPDARFGKLARKAFKVTRESRLPVLLNSHTETAQRVGYRGVHWPEARIPEQRETRLDVRGASVHSPEAARRAEAAGADFVVAGTVFDAGSKPVPGEGIDHLRAIASATHLPVLAIGGINPDNVESCIQAGASGVAVVTNVLRAPDMEAAVKELRRALDAAAVPGGTR